MYVTPNGAVSSHVTTEAMKAEEQAHQGADLRKHRDAQHMYLS